MKKKNILTQIFRFYHIGKTTCALFSVKYFLYDIKFFILAFHTGDLSKTETARSTQMSTNRTTQITLENTSQMPTKSTSQVPTNRTTQITTNSTSQVPTKHTAQMTTKPKTLMTTKCTCLLPTNRTPHTTTGDTSQLPTYTTQKTTKSTSQVCTCQLPTNRTTQMTTDSTSQVPTNRTTQMTTQSTSQVATDRTTQMAITSTSQVITKSTSQMTTDRLLQTTCMCPCSRLENWSRFANVTIEELAFLLHDEIEAMKKELTVKKKTLSKYIRTITSAPDDRTSSESMGFVSIVCIIVPFAFIIMTDILNIYLHFCKAPENNIRFVRCQGSSSVL